MISAILANQWNPKHFHKMSQISQNTVFFHVFLVFSHSNCGVILSCYSGGPFFSHSKFGVSSFGNCSLILSSSPALYAQKHLQNFYTQKPLHSFYTQRAFTQRSFYIQKAFTQRSFYIQQAFTQQAFTQRSFYTQKAFTQQSFYTEKPFHREAFTQRSFYTQKLLHTASF